MLVKQRAAHHRRMEILGSLDQFEFLTTSQIRRLHNLVSNRNTLRIMKDLESYFDSYIDGEKIYYLNDSGRNAVGSHNKMERNLHVLNKVFRNEIYITFQPENWDIHYSVVWNNEKNVLRPDAFFTYEGKNYFLEVDNLQIMSANERKIKQYRQLYESGEWRKAFETFPTIFWLTTDPVKQAHLKRLCRKYELNVHVRTLNDLKDSTRLI